MSKTVRICGREYKLKFSEPTGGCFYCSGKSGSGDGEIYIGKYKDISRVAEILLHEIIEAILVEDSKRFVPTGLLDDNSNRLFMFTHEYFDMLICKIIDGMKSSGFFKIIDNRKNI